MPGLESSSYPPGQYVVPPRGNRSAPAYPNPPAVVPANTPQTPSRTGAALVILDIAWAAAAASGNQVQIEPSPIGGAETIAFPEHAAADATITHTQMTFPVPAGCSWRWITVTGTAPTVTATTVPLSPTSP